MGVGGVAQYFFTHDRFFLYCHRVISICFIVIGTVLVVCNKHLDITEVYNKIIYDQIIQNCAIYGICNLLSACFQPAPFSHHTQEYGQVSLQNVEVNWDTSL